MSDGQNTSEKALALLKQFYGYDSFRPLQLEIIKNALEGNDSLVLMPTGGGKSLCFQIPALVFDGVTIVISPLLALMKDQVEGLQNAGIPAAAINSLQTESENRRILDAVYHRRIKLLYVSPERFVNEIAQWKEAFPIAMFAIDEAHCISQWGHDFRPEYTQLNIIHELFADTPVMALTATADRTTRDDIVSQLRLRSPACFISSFDRPNITLRVVSGAKKQQRLKMIRELISRYPGESGIVYCLSRKIAEQMAADLSKMGYSVGCYHAGLDAGVRNQVQTDFICDNISIVCATVAFGMGIDKSNIRWVVHNNMPQSIENYYQEIGRAGRDGLPAEALLFYSLSDVIMRERFVSEGERKALENEKLRHMRRYAEASVCRRRMLLSYFNEVTDHDCDNCDVCFDPPKRIDGTRMAQMGLSAIARTNGEAGISMLIDILRGSSRADLISKGYNRIKTFGVGHNMTYREWEHYLEQMFQLGLYEVDYSHSRRLVITEYGRKILFQGANVQFSEYRAITEMKNAPAEKTAGAAQTYASPDLLRMLKELRLKISRQSNGLPAYLIFNDKVLNNMAASMPLTLQEFSSISGIGRTKAEKYWHPFVNLIRSFKGLEPFPATDEIDLRIRRVALDGTPLVEIGQTFGFSTRDVCRRIADMIADNRIEDFDNVCPRNIFVDIIGLNRTLSEQRFLVSVREKYCDGMELIVFAAANAMLRKRN